MHNNNHRDALRVLAWETTHACTLACPHCRAKASLEPAENELTTAEAFVMLESAALLGTKMLILSGGEPLLRKDLEEVAVKACELGIKPVVSCNDGRLLSDDRLESLKKSGINHFSFSMHSEDEEEHDKFVRVENTYNEALKAFERIKKHGMSFQINTTVLPVNYKKLESLKDWVKSLGASAWHLFFLVPMGRAEENLNETSLDKSAVNEVIKWLAHNSDNFGISTKITCAPQYAAARDALGYPAESRGRSCMAGKGFLFVGKTGDVKPCGYFEKSCGNIRQQSLEEIYRTSEPLLRIRNPELLQGFCSKCKMKVVCGGCRARALAVNGDLMAEDPNCIFAK
ncbi:MAG: radical SAM protein [Candidatus Riflebacteria bacterium]|nr:radical SAM protein [Candidatus Riflebacteria bacterium]